MWESVDLPRDVSKLWEDVAKGIDKNQTGTLLFRRGHMPYRRRFDTRILRNYITWSESATCDAISIFHGYLITPLQN